MSHYFTFSKVLHYYYISITFFEYPLIFKILSEFIYYTILFDVRSYNFIETWGSIEYLKISIDYEFFL